LLDVLKAERVRATFFVVGQRVQQFPEIVRRIAAEGHVIGHHSYTHSKPESTSAAELLSELSRTQEAFARTIGCASHLFRPPWGKLSARKLWKLTRSGYKVVLWNSDPRDYQASSAATVRNWFGRNAPMAGDLILMHDTHPFAAEVMPALAAAVRCKGLAFATVDEWVR
jgi:peptidoglycan/xylan/chitin deacetylase (PgdA/CDA1 family)